MRRKKLLLYQVYDGYDYDKDGDMCLKGFGQLLLKMDPTFTEEEIRYGFTLVDTSKDGALDLDEFR